MQWFKYILVCFSFVFLSACGVEEYSKSEEWKKLKTSFEVPVGNFIEEEKDWSDVLSANIAYTHPLEETTSSSSGTGSQGSRSSSGDTVSFTMTYNPLTYWFFRGTAYEYINGSDQQPWNPDFSYVFGYDDWHKSTLSLTYANYGGNRWNPDEDEGEKFTRFEEGTITLGYKFDLFQNVETALSPFEDGSIGCDVNYNWTPRFGRLDNPDKRGHWKQHATLGCKWSIIGWWYTNWRLNWYPLGSKHQQPWDPDYTYGFGYFDWHKGTISVQYNNFAGNRYPWKNDDTDNGGFQ